MKGGSLYISLSGGWSWIKCHLLMTLVRLLPAPVGADKKHPSPTDMLRLFSFDSHAIQKSPWPQEHLSSLSQSTSCGNWWNASHVAMRLVLVSDNFIPKGPWEVLWLVQGHRPVFGSVKLAPIKYEESFVPRHMKSDEGLFWKSRGNEVMPEDAIRRSSCFFLWKKNKLNSTKISNWRRNKTGVGRW